MQIISIVSPLGCNETILISKLSQINSFKIVEDGYIISRIYNDFGIPERKIRKYIFEPGDFLRLDKLRKQQYIALFKMYLGKSLLDGNIIFNGFGTYLLPKSAKAILRLCFGGDIHFRIGTYARYNRLPIEIAEKKVKEFDRQLLYFTKTYLNKSPFDPELFDANIDVAKYSSDEIINKIIELLHSLTTSNIADTKKIIQDFIIENRILAIFLGEREDIDVTFKDGILTLLLKKQKIRKENYFEYLKSIVPKIPEIEEVKISYSKEINIGVPMRINFIGERKVLLVDDEVEFVDTLSQRLQNREFRTSVAYSGEEALQVIESETPDVIILDLKMPGIDGLEVLRQVKQKEPKTEVIILTGHGSQKEREISLQLGAFAYLEKPVDINLLSQKLKEAYEIVQKSKSL